MIHQNKSHLSEPLNFVNHPVGFNCCLFIAWKQHTILGFNVHHTVCKCGNQLYQVLSYGIAIHLFDFSFIWFFVFI